MISIAPPLLRRAALAAAWLFALPALAQEAALTRRATELRDAPATQARSVAGLPAQTQLTRLPLRQGPWVQVRTGDGLTGWLHLFDLGPAGGAAAPGDGSGVGQVLRGVTGLLGGATAPRPATQAAGIRGLDAEELARAQPDARAVQRMEALRQPASDARAFAERAGWHPVAVAPLPAPAPAAAPAAAAPGFGPAGQEAQ